MLAQNKSVTEVAIAVGYDSVSAFIGMFRTMLGSTPYTYFRTKQQGREAAIAGLPPR
jgi:methylphosphotriester-DNA--protein-cysteine methyltransferase